MDIELVNPINNGDCDKSIKEMYSDFGDMNDEAIKKDTHRNGFDISPYGNKKNDDDKYNKKRKSRLSFPMLDIGSNRPPVYNNEDEE